MKLLKVGQQKYVNVEMIVEISVQGTETDCYIQILMINGNTIRHSNFRGRAFNPADAPFRKAEAQLTMLVGTIHSLQEDK